jgi:hypothetical protein
MELPSPVLQPLDSWLAWASALCCHPIAIAFQIQVHCFLFPPFLHLCSLNYNSFEA